MTDFTEKELHMMACGLGDYYDRVKGMKERGGCASSSDIVLMQLTELKNKVYRIADGEPQKLYDSLLSDVELIKRVIALQSSGHACDNNTGEWGLIAMPSYEKAHRSLWGSNPA